MLRSCAFALVLVLAATSARGADKAGLLGVQTQVASGEKVEPALITVSSEGGFRWSKTERFTAGIVSGKPSLNVERIPYEGQKQGPVAKALTAEEFAALRKTLVDSKALELKDDMSLKGNATDMPEYDVSVNLDGKTNRFRVYGPQLLKKDARYMAITDAVEALADKYSPAPQL
jgi:hypothetical protein